MTNDKLVLPDWLDGYNQSDEEWLYIGDDKVRYALGKPGESNLIIIGINPSCATPNCLDPTLKRVKKVVENSDYDGWIMLNIYPMRDKNPKKLPKEYDLEYVKNNLEVIKTIRRNFTVNAIWAAWENSITTINT